MLIILTLLPGGMCRAEEFDKFISTNNPTSILGSINHKGAQFVVNEIYKNNVMWQSLLQRIASGEEAWLKVAIALQPGTDAGTSEMLTLAVGEALEHDAKMVLTITVPTFRIQAVCGGPDIDDKRYSSLELAVRAIELRIEKIYSLKDESLQNSVNVCLSYLEASKKHIARFYGCNKK